MRALSLTLKSLLAVAVLACLFVAPATAEGQRGRVRPVNNDDTKDVAKDAPDDKDGLGAWFRGLPQEKREALVRRRNAVNAMSREQQQSIYKRLEGDGEIFTPEQASALKKIGHLDFFDRTRLHALRTELDMLKKGKPELFEKLEGATPEQRSRLLKLLAHRLEDMRASAYTRRLDSERRKEFEKLTPEQRTEAFRKALHDRIEALTRDNPQFAELRRKADAGDQAARDAVNKMLRQYAAIDKVIERMEPGRRAELREKIAGKSPDEAAEILRPAMRLMADEWRKHQGDRPRGGKDREGDHPRPNVPRDQFKDRGERRRDSTNQPR